MVAELTVLLCVEHLKHGRCSVALIIAAHFIDLIKQHQWVFHAGTAQTIDNTSRHRTDISFPVSTDLRLVTDAA